MPALVIVGVFALGAIVGSFLNVIAIRHNTGRGYLRGRSCCLSCSHKLSWFDLVPVISFIFARGRCRYCNSRILLQYPIVEITAGLLALGLYIYAGSFLEAILFALIFSILLVIVIYDIYHTIVPDKLVYSLIAISAVMLFVNESSFALTTPSLIGALAGPIAFTPFFLLWLLSGGTWMGLGDAKLALAIGWFFGLELALSAIILGFWIGAVVGLSLLLRNFLSSRIGGLKSSGKQLTMKSEIPLAPFLALGVVLVYFFEVNVLILNLSF